MALTLQSNSVRGNCQKLVSKCQLQCIATHGQINQLKSQQCTILKLQQEGLSNNSDE